MFQVPARPDRPQSDTIVSFSRFHQPIFSTLSSHPVIVLEHLVHKVCFQQGLQMMEVTQVD